MVRGAHGVAQGGAALFGIHFFAAQHRHDRQHPVVALQLFMDLRLKSQQPFRDRRAQQRLVKRAVQLLPLRERFLARIVDRQGAANQAVVRRHQRSLPLGVAILDRLFQKRQLDRLARALQIIQLFAGHRRDGEAVVAPIDHQALGLEPRQRFAHRRPAQAVAGLERRGAQRRIGGQARGEDLAPQQLVGGVGLRIAFCVFNHWHTFYCG